MKKLLLFVTSLFIAVAMMAQYNVTFKVTVAGVNTDTTDLYVSGDFAGWAQPGSDPAYMMTAENDTTFAITVEFADGENEANFKFFQVHNATPSWTYGEWDGDPNRHAVFIGESTFTYKYAVKPVWVTFNCDMEYADFDYTVDEIFIAGNVANGWAQPGTIQYYKLAAPTDGDVYSISMLVDPTDDAQYKYFRIIGGEPSWDNGEWTGDPNRMVAIDTAMTIDDFWGTLAGVDEHALNAIESIYPNPCNSYVNIVLTSEINQVNAIEVYNILGEMVYRLEDISMQREVKIFTGDLNSGVYFVTVTNDQGYQAARFIKE
jgi:hypothetical protein